MKKSSFIPMWYKLYMELLWGFLSTINTACHWRSEGKSLKTPKALIKVLSSCTCFQGQLISPDTLCIARFRLVYRFLWQETHRAMILRVSTYFHHSVLYRIPLTHHSNVVAKQKVQCHHSVSIRTCSSCWQAQYPEESRIILCYLCQVNEMVFSLCIISDVGSPKWFIDR